MLRDVPLAQHFDKRSDIFVAMPRSNCPLTNARDKVRKLAVDAAAAGLILDHLQTTLPGSYRSSRIFVDLRMYGLQQTLGIVSFWQ